MCINVLMLYVNDADSSRASVPSTDNKKVRNKLENMSIEVVVGYLKEEPRIFLERQRRFSVA
jgi:hypothetical protein